jgi:hypothetical protein
LNNRARFPNGCPRQHGPAAICQWCGLDVGSAQNFGSEKRQGNETIRLDGHAGLIKLRGQLERDVEG